ncbi:sialidase family protein [Roseibacillus ishigakijimensis]|uniref:Exo-alpha-sialidase n=1 Tax=Roseibacillus ishigakijimensis TaxID=454146 RepID=A0A934VLA2_9BACT|nr:sialidase family protein [Roseibacillus ishigakijimensis]MBK1834469.1 exo-alpha-sialidase [Roseibacillus ishigakijimensis]
MFAVSVGLVAGTAVAVPFLDLAGERERQVTVDREEGQYLGHVTTCLLDDGKTILAVYPKGHGRGGIVYKRSEDGGKTWSERLATPDSWATSQEVPTLHRMTDADGRKRIVLWSGMYPARYALSEDEGKSWSELHPAGDWGGIVVMGAHLSLKTGPGHYACYFHDDGRFFRQGGERGDFTLYQSRTRDGGVTWEEPEVIWTGGELDLCEPGAVRSPDGGTIALLLRENSRQQNSQIIFSQDEGETWSEPRPLARELTGDRHTVRYAPDGRLVVVFRGVLPGKQEFFSQGEARGELPTVGDCALWVGTWEDLQSGGSGEMLVRLLDNKKGLDSTYPGVELLPDGTFVVTTYGTWDDASKPFIKSVRFRLDELDARLTEGE